MEKEYKNRGGIPGKEIDWNRNKYGRLAFPDWTNYFGAITSVFSATRTKSDGEGLRRWWNGLVEELGIEGAEAERERTFARGRRIDDTAEMLVENIEEFNFRKKSFEPGFKFDNKMLLNQISWLNNNADFDTETRVIKWMLTNQIEILANELPVWSKARRSKGYLDFLIRKDGTLYVLDFKGANKSKNVKFLDAPTQQVSGYCDMIREMSRNAENGSDSDAKNLLSQISNVSAEEIENVQGMLLYFVDDKDEPEEIELLTDKERSSRLSFLNRSDNIRKLDSWKEHYKYISIDWRNEQFDRKLTKYNSYPVALICDGSEGFFRRRWKRVPPENVISADDFIERELKEFNASRKSSVKPQNFSL